MPGSHQITILGTRRIVAVLALAGLLGGCAGTRTYVASPENNVRFTTVTKSGSLFSSVRAGVKVYSVDANCRPTYRGTIRLDRSSVASGLPAGRPSYLEFVFSSSSFLANRRSSINYRALLTPKPGYRYDIEVSYVDDSYNAVVREVHPRRRKSRQLAYRDLGDCRKRLARTRR